MEKLKGNSRLEVVALDDDFFFLASLKRGLRCYGYNLRGFTSPAEAFAELEKNHGCHAFITDMLMPELSGDKVLEYVHQKHPEQRCIVVTGHPDKEKIRRALKAGNVCQILLKPFEFKALLESLESLKS